MLNPNNVDRFLCELYEKSIKVSNKTIMDKFIIDDSKRERVRNYISLSIQRYNGFSYQRLNSNWKLFSDSIEHDFKNKKFDDYIAKRILLDFIIYSFEN